MQCIQMALTRTTPKTSGQKQSLLWLGALYRSKEAAGAVIFEAMDYKNETGIKHNPLYHLTIGGYWQIGQIRPMAIYQYQWGRDRYKQHTAQV